jgi:hypothetical protein
MGASTSSRKARAHRSDQRLANREPLREAISAFLRESPASSKNAECVKCGATSGLARATLFFSETGETWEIWLPVCEGCAAQETTNAARSEHEPVQGGTSRAARSAEPGTPATIETARLLSEMHAIHAANRLYWEGGATVTLEARAEHAGRQVRLEEIRTILANLPSARKRAVGVVRHAVSAATNNETREELYVLGQGSGWTRGDPTPPARAEGQ